MSAFPPGPRRLLALAAVVLLSLLGASGVAAASTPSPASRPSDTSKLTCAYSNESISELRAFGQMVGRSMDCAMVYNDDVSTWEEWEHPWFVNYVNMPNLDWSRWATAPGTHRRLIITQDLFPLPLSDHGWLQKGAHGDYQAHARVLARYLVAEGLGDSVIRLAPEANGSWFADSLGATVRQWREWDRFWDDTVSAMRQVPGAHFQFDWCLSALYRDLPLQAIYPGDRYVNIIGIDLYDDGEPGLSPSAHWRMIMNSGDGLGTTISFARDHDKPISIPEWGVNTVSGGGHGDDPTFVNGIAAIVRDTPTAYQSYFYKYGQQTQLAPGTQSLLAYRANFGRGLVAAQARHEIESRDRRP